MQVFIDFSILFDLAVIMSAYIMLGGFVVGWAEEKGYIKIHDVLGFIVLFMFWFPLLIFLVSYITIISVVRWIKERSK